MRQLGFFFFHSFLLGGVDGAGQSCQPLGGKEREQMAR